MLESATPAPQHIPSTYLLRRNKDPLAVTDGRGGTGKDDVSNLIRVMLGGRRLRKEPRGTEGISSSRSAALHPRHEYMRSGLGGRNMS